MKLKPIIHAILWVVGSMAVLCLLGFFALVTLFSYSYWWDRDQWNQEKIVKAYISYYQSTTNFPRSLAELVRTGYLPEKAEWYKEPPGFYIHPFDFKESCYIVQAPESNDVAKLEMIGRRDKRNGKEEIQFEPMQNAIIRDAVKAIQEKWRKGMEDIHFELSPNVEVRDGTKAGRGK